MFCNIKESLKKQSTVIALIAAGFVLSIVAGMATARWKPGFANTYMPAEDAGYEAIESIFGRFREPVREGEPKAMATCMLIVFGFNTLGSVIRTVSSAFIIPLTLLFFSGWGIGASLFGVGGSSFLSVFMFYLMISLEWVTYVLSAAAGASIGLAVLFPSRVECSTRWSAFKRAISHAGSLYVVITLILAVQAVVEMFYVRHVLLMGGTGVPLAPW